MIVSFSSLVLSVLAPLNLKQEVNRLLCLESYCEVLEKAEQLEKYDDPEALYLACASFARNQKVPKSLAILKEHKQKLKDAGYYNRCLEELSLSVFHAHFQSSQEPIKMAALAAISQESDSRILPLLLEALQMPSLKIKMLALRSLSSFADEKVKKILNDYFCMQQHASVHLAIAKLFSLWQDSRLVTLIYKKLAEDTLSLDEKIQYILILKDLCEKTTTQDIEKYAVSNSASLRALATHLWANSSESINSQVIENLLNDSNLWVKQSALNSIIKKRINSDQISQELKKWKGEKSIELNKGYFYFGLVKRDSNVIAEFYEKFISSDSHNQKLLAAILYASGPGYDDLGLKIIDHSKNAAIKIQIALYLLAGKFSQKGTEIVLNALDELSDRKLYVISDSVYPFFVIDDEKNSSLSISAGQRRSMDKHLRLRIFHLLALKKHPGAKEVLKQLLKTDLFELSLDAMVHFWENFGYEDSDYLKNILKDHDPDLRLKAALVLNYLDYDKSVRTYLMECFPKQTYSMQIQILFALSKYHEEDVIDFFIKTIESKYPVLQAISAGCLFTSLYR